MDKHINENEQAQMSRSEINKNIHNHEAAQGNAQKNTILCLALMDKNSEN